MGSRSEQQRLSTLIVGSLVAGFGAATLLHALVPPGVPRAGWTLLAGGVLLLAGILTTVVGWRAPFAPSPVPPPPPATAPAIHVEIAEPKSTATDMAIEQVDDLERVRPQVPYVHKEKRALRIVAIGGGTGMPQLLRGLRAHTDLITAIVTVADDGGSSGRLRRQMGLLPPGDFRNNIAALSESEDLITRLFQYRFAAPTGIDNGEEEARNELAGHSFGNLFIATMAAVTGSFESGLAESSRVLAVRGRVLPSTLEQVHLCAEVRRTIRTEAGEEREEWLQVEGESQIPGAGGQIVRVFLKPAEVRAYPEVIRAILQADLIVAGPGSFFTSIMPNLLVPAVRDAIIASPAPSIYLCNVATQPGETDGYTVSDHMAQLRHHAGSAFTTVLANHTYDPQVQLASHSQWVTLPSAATPGQQVDGVQISDCANGMPVEYRLFTGDLVDAERSWRHNPQKVAARLVEVCKNILSQNLVVE